MSTRFRGKYLEYEPLGIKHVLFTESGNHYTWRQVTSVVHNFILGKLWIDNQGSNSIVG